MHQSDPGILIAFEGIDGAGKTTQVGLLAHFLSLNWQVVCSKEPTEGPWGQLIRQSAKAGRLSAEEELRILLEDRKEHVRELILPALKQGKIVILDRYFYSTIAYQGSRRRTTSELARLMTTTFPVPDLVFLLDVPAEVGLSRIKEGRGDDPNSFEDLANLTSVRREFCDSVAKLENVVMIDGTQEAEVIHRQIVSAFKTRLPRLRSH